LAQFFETTYTYCDKVCYVQAKLHLCEGPVASYLLVIQVLLWQM